MSEFRCMVGDCLYVAESAIEDFAVCPLHDHVNVRAMLEKLVFPVSRWMRGAPLVMSGGDLHEEYFISKNNPLRRAIDCPDLAEAPSNDRFIFQEFRLS